MKRVILKIGYKHYVMRNAAQATAALKALSVAIPVREHYRGGEEGYVYLAEDRENALSVSVVDSKQVKLSAPPRLNTKAAKLTNG